MSETSEVQKHVKAQGDKNASVHREAAYALGQIADESAVRALIETLKDKNETVRLQARDALQQLPGLALRL